MGAPCEADQSGPSTELAVVRDVRAGLAHAMTLLQFKDVRDKAAAVKQYLKNAHHGLRMQNDAAVIKLHAERQLGNLLAGLHLRGGDHKTSTRQHCVTLAELGVKESQSAQWQRVASLPDDELRRFVDACNAADKEVTTAAVLRLAKKLGQAGEHGSTTTCRPMAAGAVRKRGAARHKCPSNGEPLVLSQKATAMTECIEEAKNHVEAVAKLFESICAADHALFGPSERKYVRRLLAESTHLLKGALDDLASLM